MALNKRNVSNRVDALRIFHGPGEGEGPTRFLSLDRYGPYGWVSYEGEEIPEDLRASLAHACKNLGFKSAFYICRHRKGQNTEPAQILYGEVPNKLVIQHQDMNFEIDFNDQRHPGLFLDMDSARNWIKENSQNKTVLNLFSYTGSLSVAAGVGGAREVFSVDLSKHYTEWAKRNWALNHLAPDRGEFLFGDTFDWLKRFKKQSRTFDVIICDPPSFSRTKTRQFSTSKNTVELHEAIFSVLGKYGVIVTSINSESVSRQQFMADVMKASKNSARKVKIQMEFSLPKEFPTAPGDDPYLKGLIIKDMTKL